MEPPICEITGEEIDPAVGRRIRFVATDAGAAFDASLRSGTIAGDSPDEGWFSPAFADAAAALAETHTLPEAVRQLRVGNARTAWERRATTQVRHVIDPPIAAATIVDAIRAFLPEVLARLALASVEPVIERRRSTSPGPEWREAVTTTEVSSTETWASADHRVVHGYEDTRWDGWDGRPRTGDLMQGTASLKIDDTWVFAPFGGDAMVDHLDVSGEHTPQIAALVDELIQTIQSTG
ncbi:MAG: hypothetical protein AAGA90_06005 [Actinomycetota bacterium]